MRKPINVPAIVLLLATIALVGVGVYRAFGVKVAPMPAAFAGSHDLDAAIARASAEGKVVVAVISADWCPPCQAYKRGALADPAVAEWLGRHAIAVHLDADAQPDDAERLGVQALPSTVVITGSGELVNRQTGAFRSGSELIAWLDAARGASNNR